MSSLPFNSNIITETFEEFYVYCGEHWDFFNNVPCVVKEYILRDHLSSPNKKDFIVDIWPNDPRYKLDHRYQNQQEAQDAYEFLKDKTYVGYFSDDYCGPCRVLCYKNVNSLTSDECNFYELWPGDKERSYFYYPQVNKPVKLKTRNSFLNF